MEILLKDTSKSKYLDIAVPSTFLKVGTGLPKNALFGQGHKIINKMGRDPKIWGRIYKRGDWKFLIEKGTLSKNCNLSKYINFQSTKSFTYAYIYLHPKACRVGREGRGCACNTPYLFWNLLVFWQNVSVKFPDLMLSVNLEFFIIKNKTKISINIQSEIKLLPTMTFKDVI